MKLTSAVQEALIALLCYDKEKAPEILELVDLKLYDPYFREIAESAADYYYNYKLVPGDHTLDLIDSLSNKAPDKEEIYRKLYDSIQLTKSSINKEYILQQAVSFVRYQRLKQAMSGAVRSLQREDEAGLVEAEATLERALGANATVADLGVSLFDLSRSLEFLNVDETVSIPTGIPGLDKVGLGPARKRLFLFIGVAGAGKSWFLVNLAKYAYMSRYRVLYVTLELSEQELCQRALQGVFSIAKKAGPITTTRLESDADGNFVGIDTGSTVKRASFQDDDIYEMITNRVSKLRNKKSFKIKEFPTGALTVKGLENYLDILEAREGFIPDLLILDYADLMSVDSKNYRLDLGQLYKQLRGIANKRNLAIATASQANRAAVKAKWITGDNASEDWSKIATADTVVTYNQTPAEHQLGLARLFVAKGRTDKDKFAILISQSYAMGQFFLDSVSYTPNYWEDLKTYVTDAVIGGDDTK